MPAAQLTAEERRGERFCEEADEDLLAQIAADPNKEPTLKAFLPAWESKHGSLVQAVSFTLARRPTWVGTATGRPRPGRTSRPRRSTRRAPRSSSGSDSDPEPPSDEPSPGPGGAG